MECMCGYREGGVNMVTDVLYSVNMYILFCVKRFELSHVMDIALLGGSGGVVNSLDFCPAPLQSLACFYFRSILSS